MTTTEKKEIKQLFKTYKKMDRSFMRQLTRLGFEVRYTSRHIKLMYKGKLFICPSSGSDYRGGRNLASAICSSFG